VLRPITYKQKLVRSFNFTFRYIDDVISLKHSKLGDRFVPIKLIIMETTYASMSASYLDLHKEINRLVKLRTKLFNFLTVSLHFKFSPAAPTYVVYIYQLILLSLIISLMGTKRSPSLECLSEMTSSI
jgi:hypothetical protein